MLGGKEESVDESIDLADRAVNFSQLNNNEFMRKPVMNVP